MDHTPLPAIDIRNLCDSEGRLPEALTDPALWDDAFLDGPALFTDPTFCLYPQEIPGPLPLDLFCGPPARSWLNGATPYRCTEHFEGERVVGFNSTIERRLIRSFHTRGLTRIVSDPGVVLGVIDVAGDDGERIRRVHAARPTFFGDWRGTPSVWHFTHDPAQHRDPIALWDTELLSIAAAALGYSYKPMIAGTQWTSPDFPSDLVQ